MAVVFFVVQGDELHAMFFWSIEICSKKHFAHTYMSQFTKMDKPIICSEMLPGTDGNNINGPCLTRVPSWVTNPLGRYYLYFAHHQGRYIRMAYADAPTGPWTVYAPGVFDLKQLDGYARKHVASPEVIWDDETRVCRMYIHAPVTDREGQWTFLVCGGDGLTFGDIHTDALTPSYLRLWRHQANELSTAQWYGMTRAGQLFRSLDGQTDFEAGPNPFPTSARVRHVGIERAVDGILLYGTSIGACPELIWCCYMSTVDPDWNNWTAHTDTEIIRPTLAWEGALYPKRPSKTGPAQRNENALRDPHIYIEDSKRYLTYCAAGEKCIGIAVSTI